MKITKTVVLPALMGLMSLTMYSCKTKKIVAQPAPVQQAPPPPPPAPAPIPVPQPEPVETVAKPDFNFSNVLFEFDSAVLKTESFQILDRAVAEMKKATSAKVNLNGHSSIEGTPEHNMSLSIDRANSVKSFLVNAGVSAANISVKGFGVTQPVTSNDTEEGRAQNRRVEIKVVD